MLPVQRKFQNQFGGTVIEVSGKGSTVFMEPNSISKLQDEITALSIEEDSESRCILYTMSALVSEHASAIRRNTVEDRKACRNGTLIGSSYR